MEDSKRNVQALMGFQHGQIYISEMSLWFQCIKWIGEDSESREVSQEAGAVARLGDNGSLTWDVTSDCGKH